MLDLEELVTKDFIFDQNASDWKSKTNSKIGRGYIDDLMVEIDQANENNSRLDRFFLRTEIITRQFKPLEII